MINFNFSGEFLKTPLLAIANFVKENRLGSFYWLATTAAFSYGISNIHETIELLSKDRSDYGEVFFIITAIIFLFATLCLLYISDSKKFLNKHLNNKKTSATKYKILLLVLWVVAFALLYVLLRFKNTYLSGGLLFLLNLIVVTKVISLNRLPLWITKKDNDLQYISYIGAVTTFWVLFLLLFALLPFILDLSKHNPDSLAALRILYIFTIQAIGLILLSMIFKNVSDKSDPFLIKLLFSSLIIMMIFTTLGHMVGSAPFLFRITKS